ncbi:succinate dehydrogenase assembly factor 4, mitochondrial isoform X1 [Odocoileus virginianus]|uniref:Succinate dehydrogenase assembly factor 4, mitochondrial n=2 Tax=Odocoileus virginianus TaxID=9874 RepID=A0ABM4GSM1_ODOVR
MEKGMATHTSILAWNIQQVVNFQRWEHVFRQRWVRLKLQLALHLLLMLLQLYRLPPPLFPPVFTLPGSPLLCNSLRKISSQGGKTEPSKQPLKKPKLPEGRFDAPEDSNLEKEPLTKFPDDINPVTKEKGGPRGPEPTRYGDWERKGRCIDF